MKYLILLLLICSQCSPKYLKPKQSAMKRYIFTRDITKPYADIKVIETSRNLSEIWPADYSLFTITKI